MGGFIGIFRTGTWLTAERMRLVSWALLIASAAGSVYLIATANGLLDVQGRPLGTDFSSFYAAGTLVRDGQPAAPFDLAAHFSREQAIFGAGAPHYSFSYPPFFLFIAGALALLSYPLALAIWQVASFAFYLLSIRAVVGIQPNRIWLLLAAAFPPVFINLGHGQNGFLTAALFGLALAMLDRRPILAGVLLGLMAYKPQFGLMIPLVLLATFRGRTIAAAAATVAALVLASVAAFGQASWRAFFAAMPFARTVALEQGNTGWFKIQSMFSSVRMWGGSVEFAYAMQGALAMLVALTLVWLWRSAAPYPLKAAALAIGSLLATPFILDYDLMLLAPAIAYLAVDGIARGFWPWEKTILAALWIVPLIARSVPQATLVPLAVPMMLLALALLLRRAMIEAGIPQAGGIFRRVP
jgi:hypothetical protein